MATWRAKEKRWAASWLNPSTGKREYFYARTKEQAEELKERAQGGAPSRGPTPSVDLDLHTLAGLLWWPRVQGSRPNTVRRYKDAYEHHVRPFFGHKIPEDIRPVDVQRWANEQTRGGVSANSISLYRAILSAILRCCIAERLIYTNPASTVRLPKTPRRIRTMSLAELRALLGKVEGTELAAPVFLAAVLGLSRGELCGLKWTRVDRERRRIAIVEQRLIRQGVKGKSVGEGPTKRDSRVRAFVLPQSLFDALERVGDLDSAYVCTNHRGTPWNPEHLTSAWAAGREKLGFTTWHFHDLRHGAAGILASLGVDLLTIAAVLGHASINTSMLYASAQESTATSGFEKVGAALFPVDKDGRLIPD